MYIGIPVGDQFYTDPEHHITITFNGHGETKRDYLASIAALAETCRWWHENHNGRVDLAFGETGVFDRYCWHSKVHSNKLPRFRDKLVQELDRYGVYHSEDYEFKPHVTLNYGAAPTHNPYQGLSLMVTSFAVESRNFGRTEIRV